MAPRLAPRLFYLAIVVCILVSSRAGAVDGVAGSVREAPAAGAPEEAPKAHPTNALVRSITIRAPRDLGYFQGDLVMADVDLVVADGTTIEAPSLPHPGPITYWLDLKSIDVTSRADGANRRYTLKLVYQDFYDALDARPQEIPTFPVTLRRGDVTATADVPAWTIGVSPLREVAPPVKEDPKDYLRADTPAPFVPTDSTWIAAAIAGVATALALVLLAFDRAYWPFHARPVRVFGQASRRLRRFSGRPDGEAAYLEALLLLHRGIDATDGRRVLSDDLPGFLRRHAAFGPLSEGFSAFFAASRQAFFGSDPARARAVFGLAAIQAFAKKLADVERASS